VAGGPIVPAIAILMAGLVFFNNSAQAAGGETWTDTPPDDV